MCVDGRAAGPPREAAGRRCRPERAPPMGCVLFWHAFACFSSVFHLDLGASDPHLHLIGFLCQVRVVRVGGNP